MKTVLTFFLTLKFSLFVVILLAASLLPHAVNFYSANFRYPENEAYSVKTAFKTWDAQHYLYLADKGYHKEDESIKFFPLFPWLIHLASFITRDTFFAGLAISTFFSLGVVYFFYKFANLFLDLKTTKKAVLLFLTFPTAFYLSLIYTESLFLFLILGFFYYLFKKQYYLAGFLAFFIPFARPVGLLILLPFLFFYLTDPKKRFITLKLPSFKEKVPFKLPKDCLALLFPLLGIGLYFLFMQQATGNFFSGFSTENRFIGGYRIENLLSPSVFLQTFFTPNLSLHEFTTSLVDRAFFLFYLLLLPFIYRFDKTLFVYSLVFGMVPLFGSFMGYTRYLLPVFPLFLVLAKFFSQKRPSTFYLPVLFFFYSLQVLFLVLHALNYWVS